MEWGLLQGNFQLNLYQAIQEDFEEGSGILMLDLWVGNLLLVHMCPAKDQDSVGLTPLNLALEACKSRPRLRCMSQAWL